MSLKTKRVLCYHCGNSLVRNQKECLLLLFAGMSRPVLTMGIGESLLMSLFTVCLTSIRVSIKKASC